MFLHQHDPTSLYTQHLFAPKRLYLYTNKFYKCSPKKCVSKDLHQNVFASTVFAWPAAIKPLGQRHAQFRDTVNIWITNIIYIYTYVYIIMYIIYMCPFRYVLHNFTLSPAQSPTPSTSWLLVRCQSAWQNFTRELRYRSGGMTELSIRSTQINPFWLIFDWLLWFSMIFPLFFRGFSRFLHFHSLHGTNWHLRPSQHATHHLNRAGASKPGCQWCRLLLCFVCWVNWYTWREKKNSKVGLNN